MLEQPPPELQLADHADAARQRRGDDGSLARDPRALDDRLDSGEQIRALLAVAHLHPGGDERGLHVRTDRARIRPDDARATPGQDLGRGHA